MSSRYNIDSSLLHKERLPFLPGFIMTFPILGSTGGYTTVASTTNREYLIFPCIFHLIHYSNRFQPAALEPAPLHQRQK
jgi:hypothetical protein